MTWVPSWPQQKSNMFSTAKEFRDHLSTHTWPLVEGCVQVFLHFRDLGTHINTTSKFVGTTLTERMEHSILCVKRIRWLPHSFAKKAQFILALLSQRGYTDVKRLGLTNQCWPDSLPPLPMQYHTVLRCVLMPYFFRCRTAKVKLTPVLSYL